MRDLFKTGPRTMVPEILWFVILLVYGEGTNQWT